MAYLRNGYWYRSRRVNGHVLTDYLGNNDLTLELVQADAEKQQQRAQERAERHAQEERQRAMDRQLDMIAGQVRSLVDAALIVSGYHKHSGTWRRARA